MPQIEGNAKINPGCVAVRFGEIEIDLEMLQQMQDSFATATGTASIMIDMDGNLLTRPSNFSEVCRLIQATEKGRQCCNLSDNERSQRALETDSPVYHMCRSCGFLDGSVALNMDGRRIGYWLVGQCNALGVNREDIALHARTVGADVDAVLSAFDKMEPISPARFEHVLECLDFLAKLLVSRIATSE